MPPPAVVRPFAPSYVLVVPLMVIIRRPLAPPPPRVRSLLLLRRSDTPHARHPPGAAIVFGLPCGAGGAGAPPPALVIPLAPRLRSVVAFEDE